MRRLAYLKENGLQDEEPEWVSADSRQRAIETNRVWTLQWYPATPVGSYTIAAATLTELFEHLQEHGREYT